MKMMAAMLTAAFTVASADAEEVLATWTLDMKVYSMDAVLALKDDEPALHLAYSDGSGGWNEIAQRPSPRPGTRRFDTQPGSDQSEYIVVDEAGTVSYFAWEGRQFAAAKDVVIHDAFKTLPATRDAAPCVPRTLSTPSMRTITLYKRLRSFKDEPEFSRMGFATTGPYNAWLKEAQGFEREDSWVVMDELNFLPGDLAMLGMSYMAVATRGGSDSDRSFIADTEQRVKAGLVLATCTD